VDGSAYLGHVELMSKANNSKMPESFYTDPLMYQGGSDAFLGPRDPIPLSDPKWGCDMEGEIAVITDDVPMGVSLDEAADHIKLVMLCNDVSLRGLMPTEFAKGFGFLQSKPSSAFSPVCVTPDELGDAWKGSVIHLPLQVDYNERPFGRANAGVDAIFTLAQLVTHAAKSRPLGAGTVIGSGTVSNQGPGGDPGKPLSDGGLGYSCIAEIRMVETIADGEAKTPFMAAGDTVKIQMLDAAGHSIFGSIEQQVVAV
jgi:fumarylacetoacetate (FAA) hydrolase